MHISENLDIFSRNFLKIMKHMQIYMYQNTCILNRKCSYINKLIRISAFDTAVITNS